MTLAATGRAVACGLALLALAACAPVRVRPTPSLLAAQSAREQALADKNQWIIDGRIGVSDGHDGGSGSLTWVRNGASYQFTVRAPVTGRSFRLVGDADSATLEGLDAGALHGANARNLLARALGWRVPLPQLRNWVRGLRAPGSAAQLTFGDDGLPATLVQDGWTVEYRDWFHATTPPLPRRVYASRGPYQVRLAIRSWSLGRAAAPSPAASIHAGG